MKQKNTRTKENEGCSMTLKLIQEGTPPTTKVLSAGDVFKCMRFLCQEDRENFYCLHLNAVNSLLGKELISMGTLTNVLIHPREIFKAAILNNSANIILVHNHPSGSCTPSAGDIAITQRLVDAGKLIGIDILDHIVISSNGNFFSFNEKKLIAQKTEFTAGEKRGKYRVAKKARKRYNVDNN